MLKDTEAQLVRNLESPELVAAIESGLTRIECRWLSDLGYPFQYRVNEGYLAQHGYHYDIRVDAWIRD